MAKPSIGFPTTTAAYKALQEIAMPYGVEQEFFHPLLQRVFVEQPYWCDPPGPCFTKFKWIKQTLANGATTDRWFMAYGDGEWVCVSYVRAVKRQKFSLDHALKAFARDLLVQPIVSDYRDRKCFCEVDGCTSLSMHVHHLVPFKQIFQEAIALVTDDDRHAILASYDWKAVEQFRLPTEHPFTQHILKRHREPILQALCFKHHNDAHGKQTHDTVLRTQG